MDFIGISRSPVYSPHSEERDARIFDQLSVILRKRGHWVVCLSEDEVDHQNIGLYGEGPVIFSMGRHPHVLQLLAQLQSQGRLVVNSATGIMQLSRRNIYASCLSLGLNIPKQYSEADYDKFGELSYPCWLKRDDACSQQMDDVCFVANQKELLLRLESFDQRGVTHYVVSEHKTGDLVKFYGVAGTSFFYWYSPKRDNGFSKFGLEKHNDDYRGYAFDEVTFQKQMNRLALRLQIPVYGGDAIVDDQGQCFLVDFNDWPSFSCCRDRASEAIADCLIQMAKKQISIKK